VLVIFRLAVCGVAKVKPHLGNEVGIQLKLVIRDGLFSLSEIEYHYQGAISGFLSDDEVNEIRRLKNGEVALWRKHVCLSGWLHQDKPTPFYDH